MGRRWHSACLLSLLLWLASGSSVAEEFSIALESGTEVPVQRTVLSEEGDRILWIPSEFGFRGGRESDMAEGLAKRGFDVWTADLHDAYFLPPGRNSLGQMDIADVAELIHKSQPQQGRLFIMSTGRGAALALMAVRHWQQSHTDRKPLGGLFLLHPNLLSKSPRPGIPPEYLPIADLSNQNILLIQPGDSAKRWYLGELIDHLQGGGSKVFLKIIPGISDGFHMRPTRSEEEQRQSLLLPRLLERSAPLLASLSHSPRSAVAVKNEPQTDWDATAFSGALQPYRGDPTSPPLEFSDMDKRRYPLDQMLGKVVLINFWATWCPPCVEEIPSLGRLKRKLEADGLVVLSVDVGEEEKSVREFLKKVPADFPVLLDPIGLSVKDWKLRAFPTTFILDKSGEIRFAYFGGLEWDNAEIVAIIEQLLAE